MDALLNRQRSAGPATSRLLSPYGIAGMSLRNRLAVAPMTRVSAAADGRPTSRMADYYAAFAAGGFGLVVTEGIYTDKAHSQGYLFQPGLADASHVDDWRLVVERVHGHGARMVAQLMHAGALSQGNPHRGNTVGPSAVQPKGQQMPFYRGAGQYAVPDAMTTAEISSAVEGFTAAAVLAREAGFDGVEIHGANGYLLDQFLTEHTNLREDEYGGDVARRLRLTVEVAEAVRSAVGTDFVVGVRVSQGKVNDFVHKWSGGEGEAATVFKTLGRLPIDYLHTTDFEAWAPAFGEGPSLAALARRYGGKPIIANGSLHHPERAAGMVHHEEADVVSLGRGALANHDWPRRLAEGMALDEFDKGILMPFADLENAERHRTLSTVG